MQYEYKERGVSKGSELFLSTQSKLAESLFFYLHRCGRFVCTREYKTIRGNFNNYLLLYLEKGSMKIENEGKTFLAGPGDAAIINCHLPHSYIAQEDQTIFVWAHFSGSNTHQFYEHIVRRSHAVFHLPENHKLKENLDYLLALHRQPDISIEAEVCICLHRTLCELLFSGEADNNSNSIRNPNIEKAIHYIKEHYQSAVEVKDIADEVNLSVYHFSRLFKQEVGCSPHEYKVILRINKAKNLLKTTDLPISEIAFQLGYEYPTSFISVFSKKVGMTPKRFRDMPL